MTRQDKTRQDMVRQGTQHQTLFECGACGSRKRTMMSHLMSLSLSSPRLVMMRAASHISPTGAYAGSWNIVMGWSTSMTLTLKTTRSLLPVSSFS